MFLLNVPVIILVDTCTEVSLKAVTVVWVVVVDVDVDVVKVLSS